MRGFIWLAFALAASSSSAFAQAPAPTPAQVVAQTPVQPGAPAPLTCPLDRPYDPNNPFALILRGERPSSRVYEDDQVVVIIPIGWDFPGHALVIPKAPVRSLLDMIPDQMGHALDVARRTGVAQQGAFGSSGFTIQQNNAKSQHVCHVHFHVVPNTPREPTPTATPEQMDEIARRLRDAFPEG